MERVLAALDGVTPYGDGYKALCPVHDDHRPSVNVKQGQEGVVLICRAGCDTGEVLARVGLNYEDLFDAPPQYDQRNGAKPAREHVYRDASGEPVARKLIWPKGHDPSSTWQHFDASGQWVSKLGTTQLALGPYRQHEARAAAAAGLEVWVSEGEKDTDSLVREGVVAISTNGGAGYWPDSFADCLVGASRVHVVTDFDEPGFEYARKVKASLDRRGIPSSCWLGKLTSPGSDISDHLAHGYALDDLVSFDPFADATGSTPAEDAPPPAILEFISAAQLADEVDNTPPAGFLFNPLWPADAYGVLAAEKKAGKTWISLDMVVSAASGTPWLGIYEVERAGPVLVFLGEGGKRKMLRRLRAIGEDRGVDIAELPITFCFRVPHLTNEEHRAEIRRQIEREAPVLVVIDPLYLAARGAKGASLYDMGEVLEAVQILCQRHEAALCIIHHWNQTGTGRSADRMSGAGPAEWGRVLASVSVNHRRTDPDTKASTVTLDIEFTGDEIPDTEVRIRRHVWTDNPDDLDSPMHYCVDQLEAVAKADPDDTLTPAARRVLAVLKATDAELNTSDIGDRLAVDNTGLKCLTQRTIQAALTSLKDAGHAQITRIDGRTAYWRAHTPEKEAENAS